MFSDDDLDPIHRKPIQKDLEPMSIEALEEYIMALQSEIDRANTMIERKKHARDGAESVFGKPSGG